MRQKTEIRQIVCGHQILEYQLTRKAVKNLNLRIRPDGQIHVSAHPSVPARQIDEFVKEKRDFILRARERYEKRKQEADLAPRHHHGEEIFSQVCQEIFPLFRDYNVPWPKVKIRTMTSCWGVCHPGKESITLNRRLLETPRSCIEYVVLHEFAHFVYPNHSRNFYDLQSALMPDWKARREKLKKYAGLEQ